MSDINLDQIFSMIKEQGHKLTSQRRFIIETMTENNQEHWSVEEIFEKVKKVHPEIGIATVYRTVQMLEDMNLLIKHQFQDSNSRYEFIDEQKNHNHHHLICVKCHRIMEVQDAYFDELERHIEEDMNFDITNHTVTFYGVCEKCRDR